MLVDVYKNLHKDVFSVRSRESTNRGKVVAHVDNAFISSVSFVIQPAGRKKVLATRRKNVHAFVRGDFIELRQNILDEIFRTYEWAETTYNPYVDSAFYDVQTSQAYKTAPFVLIKDKKVLAFSPS